jgi:hypothetical protein
MKPSIELCTIIDSYFEAITTGNPAWTERHVSQGAAVRLVGTDPAEWLTGAQAAGFLREEVKALGGVVRVAPGATEAYEEGSVGWGLTNPVLTLPNGAAISPRWSAVFHREDGDWKLVQLHASVGIANEVLLGDMASEG